MSSQSPVSAPRAGPEGIEVRLLGQFEVSVDGEPVSTLRSGRARSLLAYLVLHPDTAHPRQRLAFLFWPDSTEGQARTNLRNVLHTLRGAHAAVDASLHVTTTAVQWRPVGPATIDTERFVTAAEVAAEADPDDADQLIALCRSAADRYTGDLLDDDADDWVQPLREDMRDRYREVLRTLATALIDDGRASEATGVARALVRADPLDESAHRLRIEAHRGAGDRAGAVRAFHECAATLDRELGVEPDTVTMALYTSLVDRPHGEVPEPRRRTVVAGPRLVGRDDQWHQLTAAWEGAQRGPPAVVLLTGEAGIGKTSMVDELRAWCAGSGAVVAGARSYGIEGDLGHAVVVAWLRSPDILRALPRLPPRERAELARLLPELGSPEANDGLDDGERRRRLYDAAVAALTATERPTLLVVDDAQHSDSASQEFLHYLIRQPIEVPLLVLLTARHDDLDIAHPLIALRDDMVAEDRVTEIHLDRLPREETAALAAQLLGAPVPDDAAEALFEGSEGNPLFVVEAVRSGWDGTRSSMSMTPKLRAVIDSRLRRLSDVASTVARVAAVVGRPCSASLLGRLTGLDDMPLAQGLDELWRRGVLRASGTSSYEFSHGRIRDVAYEELGPALRSALHGAVADALVEAIGHEPELTSSQVAVHFEAANRAPDAVTWFQRASQEAQDVSAHGEAVRLLDRALGLVPDLPPDVRHLRELELLSAMPLAIAGVDGYGTQRMREAHRRAGEVAAELGVELRPAFVRSMVMSALCRDEFSAAADAAGRLRTHALATEDAGLTVESHYLLGISAFWGAELDRAREHFTAVVTDFSPSMRPGHHRLYGHDPQVVSLSRLANTLWFLGRQEEARATCEEALGMAVAVGHPLSHDTATIFSCLLAVDLGDEDLLRRCAPQIGALGMDSRPHEAKREAYLGLIDVLDGGHATGIARVRAALGRSDGRNLYPGFQAVMLRLLLAAHAAAGDAAGGLDTGARVLALRSTRLWEPEVHRVRAELLHRSGAAAGDVAAALDLAEAAARRQGAAGSVHKVQRTRAALAAPAPTV